MQLPNGGDRFEILELSCQKLRDHGYLVANLREVALSTDGMSGAELRQVVDTAFRIALRKHDGECQEVYLDTRPRYLF